MGFFGSLLKVVGKVAKAGLSVATNGLSDKVLSVFKSQGGKPSPKPASQQTNQVQAITAKYMPGPAIKSLHTKVMKHVLAGGGAMGTYAHKQKALDRLGLGKLRAKLAASKGSGARSFTKPKRGRPRQVASFPKKAGGVRRLPPPGGLDLAQMAAAWRQAGKPGTWLGWIKSNPIRRP